MGGAGSNPRYENFSNVPARCFRILMIAHYRSSILARLRSRTWRRRSPACRFRRVSVSPPASRLINFSRNSVTDERSPISSCFPGRLVSTGTRVVSPSSYPRISSFRRFTDWSHSVRPWSEAAGWQTGRQTIWQYASKRQSLCAESSARSCDNES